MVGTLVGAWLNGSRVAGLGVGQARFYCVRRPQRCGDAHAGASFTNVTLNSEGPSGLQVSQVTRTRRALFIPLLATYCMLIVTVQVIQATCINIIFTCAAAEERPDQCTPESST